MEDREFMLRAIELARKGQGSVSPNPMVGAVFVRDGKIIAEGYHSEFGGDHAEIAAVKSVKSGELKAATLYVNLEPCCFEGKTPACTDTLLKLGLRRVVIGMFDPNDKVSGEGVGILREAGLVVDVGVCEEESRSLNQAFILWITENRPYVTLKTAMSLDGKICCRDGSSQWVTNKDSRRESHRLRAENDAVLVGIGTVMSDDPHLGVRHVEGDDPLRVILDSTLHIPLDARVLRDKNVLIVTTSHADQSKLQTLEEENVNILSYETKIEVDDLISELGKRGVTSVLVEGGSKVNGSFLDSGLIDRYVAFLAPKLIGGVDAKGAIAGIGLAPISDVLCFENLKVTSLEGDFMLDARKRLY